MFLAPGIICVGVGYLLHVVSKLAGAAEAIAGIIQCLPTPPTLRVSHIPGVYHAAIVFVPSASAIMLSPL